MSDPIELRALEELLTLCQRMGVMHIRNGEFEVTLVQVTASAPQGLPSDGGIADDVPPPCADCGCGIEHHMDGGGPCLTHAACGAYKEHV